MRRTLHALAIAAAVAVPHAASVVSQSLNPPYLSEMPSNARVRAEITGSDPVDTSARQMGAFYQLMEIIKQLAGPRWTDGQRLLPDEERVRLRYMDAWQQYQYKVNAPPPQDEPRWRKLREVYEKDPALCDELLQRFFSAEFRTAYSQGTGTRPAQSAVAAPATPRSAPPQPAAPASAGSGAPKLHASATTAEDYVEQGDNYLFLYSASGFAKATEAYKRAIALQPSLKAKLVSKYVAVGDVARDERNYELAIEAYKLALALNPDLFTLRIEIAKADNEARKAKAGARPSPSTAPSGAREPQPTAPPSSAAMPQANPDPTLVTAAEKGDAQAQYRLGEYYFNQRDSENGMKWTRKAAEQGHAAAQNSLGIRYFIGGSVTKDIGEAEKWFRKSAAQEFDAAENNLCKLFAQKVEGMKGTSPPFPANIRPLKGTAADVKEAFDWCGKAAGRGYPESQFRLGALYAKGGGGVTADYEQAYFWLSVSKRPDVFQDKVSAHLTQEKRDEIEKLARAWKPGTPPFAPPKG